LAVLILMISETINLKEMAATMDLSRFLVGF
jgi:hypothetical protein